MTRAAQPPLGIVVVNWNRREDTSRCLASVYSSDYSNFQVFLVDNASTDGSVEQIHQTWPTVEILRNQNNLGFTGGYNCGIQRAITNGNEFVLLLNNDAIVECHAIATLVGAAMDHPDAGFFGPLICSLADKRTILSAGGIFADGWKATHRGIGERDSSRYDSLFEADYLSGCALLVSRKAIGTVGMLDDDYYLYHEDVDWCYRGKKLGFKALFVPNAKVWHPDTRTRDEFSPSITYYLARNALLFTRKHRLMIQALRLLSSDVRTLLSWTIKPRWRNRRKQRNALARAIADFMRGRVGTA